MNRREFAYITAFAGLAATHARGARTSGTPGKIPAAAGLITEMVFLDDCVRLAMYDNAIPKTAKSTLTEFPDYVRNGGLSPDTLAPSTPEAYALAAGRHCSAALVAHRRPDSPEARLYQDVAIMRDLAEKAGRNPSKQAPVEDLLEILHVRRRLGLHTLNPDDDIQNWLEGIITWWREQHDLRTTLASAYTAPDKTRIQEYVGAFYNPADPLIRLAREFQFGDVAPADLYPPALEQASRGSSYARALTVAVAELRKMPAPQKAAGTTSHGEKK